MEYKVIADRMLSDLLADVGHEGTIDKLRDECDRMLKEDPLAKSLWSLSQVRGSYILALAMREEEEVIISYFFAVPLEEKDAIYWLADDGEIAEMNEKLDEILEDDSIDWVGGHLGVASGPLLLRTSRAFDDPTLPEILVGVKIREERSVRNNQIS